jgi:hypothetical protein
MRQNVQLSKFVSNVGYSTALEFFERIEQKTYNRSITTFMDLLRNTPPELRNDLLSKGLQHFTIQLIDEADVTLNYVVVVEVDSVLEHHFLNTPDRMYEGDQELLEKGVHLVYTPIGESIHGEQRELRPTLDAVIQNVAEHQAFNRRTVHTRGMFVRWRLFGAPAPVSDLYSTSTKYLDVAGLRFWVVFKPTPHYCYVGSTPPTVGTPSKKAVELVDVKSLVVHVPDASGFHFAATLIEQLNKRLVVFNRSLSETQGDVQYKLARTKLNVSLCVGREEAEDEFYVVLRLLPLARTPEVVRADATTLYYMSEVTDPQIADELLDSIVQQLIA